MARNFPGFTLLTDSLPNNKNKYVKYVGRDKMFEALIRASATDWQGKRGTIFLPRGAIGVCSSVLGPASMYVSFKDKDNLLQPPYKSSYGLESGWKYHIQIYPGSDQDWEIEI